MTKKIIQLQHAPSKTLLTIHQIKGGHGIQQRLQVMGIRVGQQITLVSKQPFRGPITIKVNGRAITIGRGMATKILVEVIS
ncbi:MAG: FeoA family protein [Thermoplasmatota archaeon]